MIKAFVAKVDMSPDLGTPVVILKELDGDRSCAIPVREWEAKAIDVVLNQHSQEKHKTGWLLSYMLENVDIKILSVQIQKSTLGEILAEVAYCDRTRNYSITHSPGEAIELAMRGKATILISDSLLRSSPPRTAPQTAVLASEVQRLQARMEKAIKKEEYEEAAIIRDEILKLNPQPGNTD